ncbi:MAG: tetratricopeptide repeat protein [Phycisphaerae bacterium]|nr:tetratricopeptide repeat protein [Phycisphaerae bacterium]
MNRPANPVSLAAACTIPWVLSFAVFGFGAATAQETAEESVPPTAELSPDELYIKGEYGAAIDAYRTRLGDEPGDVASAVGLARCLMQTGNYEGASSALGQVSGVDSADWQTTSAELQMVLGRYDAAFRHAERAVEIAPERPESRLLIGQWHELFGDFQKAIEAYRWFDRQIVERAELPRDPTWLTATAQGFLRYSMLTRTNVADRTRHVLREMLQPVYSTLDRTYWPARLAAADLLRERYNNDEIDGSVSDYLAALRINEHLPQAYVGLARVALDAWNFEDAEKNAQEALKINPRFPPAWHVQAERLLIERRYDEAIAAANVALEVNPRDLIALSLTAAAHACRFDQDGVEGYREQIESIAPRCPVFHQILGTALSGIRQYADSEREFLRAIELNPNDANARNELGLMYMQWGREDKARDVLGTAFQIDPFNQRTKFTLDLLDDLRAFSTVETDHVIVRYRGDEDGVVAEAIARYMDKIYPEVTDDFETTLGEKTIIEIFPSLREFAVRITGQPWIHTIGACTGRIIALSAPRRAAGLTGPYHFARVVRHEFTHTVTLAATHNRIPHWFTEGLAVLQEDAPRSYDWMRMLSEAVRRDELFDLVSVSWAFVRPRRPTDRAQAYAQSEWMCEYIIDRFGYAKIFDMLEAFRNGKSQPEVFRVVLGVEPEDFSRDFAVWARQQAVAWGFDLTPPEEPDTVRALLAENPDNPDLQARLAQALLDAGEIGEALKVADEALEENPGSPACLAVLARAVEAAMPQIESPTTRASLEKKASPRLQELVEVDPENCTARGLLGDKALREEQWSVAREHYERLQRSCPRDPRSWRGLAAAYLHGGNDDRALPQLLELARTEEHQADVPAEIARIQRRHDRLSEAVFWYGEALFIDPLNADFRHELVETLMRADRTEDALRELETLIRLHPQNADYLSQAAIAANKIGQSDRARELAQRAVAIDPDTPARALLR